jgi:outer membrane protein assembly factor BamB
MSIRLPLLLAPLLLAGCSSIPDPFGMFESDNQEPPAELTDFTPTLQVRTLWSVDTGKGSEEQYLRLVPTAYRERLLVADSEGMVRSIDAATGQTIWQVETDAPVSGGPGAGDDLVLLGTRDAHVIALNEADGSEVWRARLSSEVLSVPRADRGIVVAHTIDGKLYGLHSHDGSRAWVYDRTVPVLTLRGNSSPVIAGGNVLAGFANGKMVSLGLNSGNPQWETQVTAPRGRSELERIVDIDADPVIYQGIAYVCTYQGEVAALSVDTGVVLWRRDLSSHAGVAANWRALYVSDAQDRVWALDPDSGAALWRQEKLLNRRLSAPAIMDDAIVVGDLEGYLHWLNNEDGAFAARLEVADAPISAAPLVVDEVAYVYAEDGTLAAVSLAGPAPEPAP